MNVLFAIVIALAAVSALGVVLSRQTIYSALSLVLTVGMLAVLFLLLDAQFLFAVQLIIYAGAVMVLFVFIVALLSPDDEDRPTLDLRAIIGILGVLVVTGLVFVAARNGITYNTNGFHAVAVGSGSNPYHTFSFPPNAVDNAGNVQTVAGQLFTNYILPFEITSMLLLVAAIGAVYLTRRSSEFPYLLGLAAFLFTVGAMGVLIRRNPIVVFMCIELMLNAANLALVAYGRFLNSEEGQIFAFMVIVVAAAEVVVGLALITQIFRLGRELDVDDLSEMKE